MAHRSIRRSETEADLYWREKLLTRRSHGAELALAGMLMVILMLS